MGTNFVLVTSILVNVRGNQHSELLLAGRKRNRASDLRTGAARRFYDFLSRCIYQAMVESLETNTNALILHLV